MHAEMHHRSMRILLVFLLAGTVPYWSRTTTAADISQEPSLHGYNSAAECDAAVSSGTARFFNAPSNQEVARRSGEVDVKTISLRDLAQATRAAQRLGYRPAGYTRGACDLTSGSTDWATAAALTGKWIPFAPDTKLTAFSDARGVVVRVTLKDSNIGFAKGLPRPVGDPAAVKRAPIVWPPSHTTVAEQSPATAVIASAAPSADQTMPAQVAQQSGPASQAVAAPAPALSANPAVAPLDAFGASGCYATVVTPPKFEMRPEVIVKVPATKRTEVIPATYKIAEDRVLVSPEHKRQVPFPATYKTVYEDVIVRPAGEREEPIPATYKTVSEQVLVKAQSTRMEVTPATYKTVTEQVMVTPEARNIRVIPATYRTEERRVVDRPATTRVETVPSTFKTVTDRVMVTPETVRYEPLTLAMRTVSEQMLSAAQSSRVETMPASYRTVTERVLVKEASKQLVEVPAEYTTVTEQVKVSDAAREWKRGRAWIGSALQVSSLSKLKVGADGTVNGVKVDLANTADSNARTSSGSRARAKSSKAASQPGVGASTGSAVSTGTDDDVMCLVDVPARYETVTRQVVKTPAAIREVEIPAEYATVSRQVLDHPASSRTVEVPPTYQSVTRVEIDIEKMKSQGYKFDEHGDVVETPAGARVLRASAVQNATSRAGAAADPARVAAASNGAASGREGYVVEVKVPAVYREQTRTVEDTPATVRTVDEPATYKTVMTKVEVTPARTEEVVTPATYKTVTRQAVDQPATSHEVVIPAVYRTVERRVVETPASTRKIPVPAVVEKIEKRVVDVPAGFREESVPAIYQTVSHRVVDMPASVREIDVPAVTETIYNRVQVAPATSSRRSVLCETNATTEKILALQRALKTAGFDPGPVDGLIGPQMVTALTRYQENKGLPVDDGRVINIDTVKALGVSPD